MTKVDLVWFDDRLEPQLRTWAFSIVEARTWRLAELSAPGGGGGLGSGVPSSSPRTGPARGPFGGRRIGSTMTAYRFWRGTPGH